MLARGDGQPLPLCTASLLSCTSCSFLEVSHPSLLLNELFAPSLCSNSDPRHRGSMEGPREGQEYEPTFNQVGRLSAPAEDRKESVMFPNQTLSEEGLPWPDSELPMGFLAMSLRRIPVDGTRVPRDSLVPEGGRKDNGMLGLLKDTRNPGVVHPGGYSCSATPAANPALPSCLWAPEKGQKGPSGLLCSPGTLQLGWEGTVRPELNPQQRESHERGISLQPST